MNLLLAPALSLPLFFVLGTILGSFGNVVAARLPAGESLGGRSHCPHCQRTLTAFELIPVFSWLLLRARCRGCNGPISPRYPLVECASGTLFLAAAYVMPAFFPALSLGIALWAMLLIALIDLRTQLIPDALTLVLALAAAVHHVLLGDFTLIPALIGFGFFGAQWLVSRGGWVGSGDVFLAGALGLLVASWQLEILSLFLAYIIGAMAAVVLLATKRIGRNAHVPFGPFLIVGAVIAFFWGERMLMALLP